MDASEEKRRILTEKDYHAFFGADTSGKSAIQFAERDQQLSAHEFRQTLKITRSCFIAAEMGLTGGQKNNDRQDSEYPGYRSQKGGLTQQEFGQFAQRATQALRVPAINDENAVDIFNTYKDKCTGMVSPWDAFRFVNNTSVVI